MKVAFVASEAIPYAKTGGLADVVGTLPQYLNGLGLKTEIFLPKYKGIDGIYYKEISVALADTDYKVKIFKEGNAFFIDFPQFFNRNGLYGTPSEDFLDNCERYTLFCRAVTQLISEQNFDIIHCHDWQTGLIPLYTKLAGLNVKTVFTIHNIGYQGKFAVQKFPLLGLDENYFNPEGIEFYGEINFLKAGILYSDVVTTVSKTYAQEIQCPEFGFGLNGVLRKKHNNIFGIINGIDYEIWNPETDNLIYTNYDDFAGKQKNKIALTDECNIDFIRPLIGMVSRIAGQKGFDLLIKTLDEIIGMGFNFILLGFGEEFYHKKLKKFEEVYLGRISINLKFDNRLAHRIYAGSDFFLMPSKYEPCGLGQLISLKYGGVPIARKVGGLADTVFQFNSDKLIGNGFLFEEYSNKALLEAIEDAYKIYCNPEIFKYLSENCMKYDFSWERSAQEYKNLYEKIVKQ